MERAVYHATRVYLVLKVAHPCSVLYVTPRTMMTVVPTTACTIAGVFAKFRHKQRSWCDPLESLRATRRTRHIPPPQTLTWSRGLTYMTRPSMFADCTGRARKACISPRSSCDGYTELVRHMSSRARIGETTCCTESQKQFHSVASILQHLTDES
jgi:hypothetical protein